MEAATRTNRRAASEHSRTVRARIFDAHVLRCICSNIRSNIREISHASTTTRGMASAARVAAGARRRTDATAHLSFRSQSRGQIYGEVGTAVGTYRTVSATRQLLKRTRSTGKARGERRVDLWTAPGLTCAYAYAVTLLLMAVEQTSSPQRASGQVISSSAPVPVA